MDFDETDFDEPATKQSVIEMHGSLLKTNQILLRIEKTLMWIMAIMGVAATWLIFNFAK